MRRQLLTVILILAAYFSVFAQYRNQPKTELIDEFGKLGHCDLTGRIDNLAISLMDARKAAPQVNVKGVIMFYKSASVIPGRLNIAPYTIKLIKDHIRLRNYDPDQFEFVDGGFREDFEAQLYLVPDGGEMPKPNGTVPAPKTPLNKTVLFDTSRVDRYFGLLEQREVIIEKFLVRDEFEEYSGYIEVDTDFDSEIPEVSEIEEFTEEEFDPEQGIERPVEPSKQEWISREFGEFLSKNRNHTGVIIYYYDQNRFDNSKVKDEIDTGVQKLLKENGLDTGRIKIVFGGYRFGVVADFWIKAPRSAMPVPTPEEPEETDGGSYECEYVGCGEM